MDENLDLTRKKTQVELSLASVKEFLLQKGGKCKYSELLDHFSVSITDSEHDVKFEEFVSNVAVKKIKNSNEEWVQLKKKYSNTGSNSHTGFFASTYQKTKNNITKLSNKAFSNKDRESLSSAKNDSKGFDSVSISSHDQDEKDEEPDEEKSRSNSLTDIKTEDEKRENLVEEPIDQVNLIVTKTPSLQSLNIDEQNNIKSVKEIAKKLNDANPTNSLKPENNIETNHKVHKYVEIESFDLSGSKPHEKEWILLCSKGDYMEISKMLFKQPYLALKKDPFNTLAHWACKHGNLDLLKLVASTLDNENKTNKQLLRTKDLINSRTGGYTCLHIAYIFNHCELVPYLKTYGAEVLADYNGLYGIDYSKNSSKNVQVIDLNENQTNDILKDANNIVKRNSSVLNIKEKDMKDDFGFNSVKLEKKRERTKLDRLAESP